VSLADREDDLPDGLPPSALYVLRVLVDTGSWMTMDELMQDTLLPESTLYYALDRLEAENLINRRTKSSNPRKRQYRAAISR
jgi:DNA-binding PadR family transcriptional regulator